MTLIPRSSFPNADPNALQCANWAFNVLFSQVSNTAINNISWKYYLVFICLNAVDLVIITIFFPETKGSVEAIARAQDSDHSSSIGKSLEEMAEIFGDEIDLRDAHDMEDEQSIHDKSDLTGVQKA